MTTEHLKNIMKIIATLSLFLWSLSTTAQSVISKIPNHIDNLKTDKHIQIKTRLYIIPPKGFELSKLGLRKNDDTMIFAFDQIFGDYYQNAKNFNREAFEKKGAKVFEYKEFTFGDYPAKIISMQTELKENKCSMVFGDKTFSIMLIGIYSSNDLKVGEQIEKAMLSIYFKKN
jgi:hypothetical protein